MSILTVGVGQQYSTIAAAVNASSSGDTVKVLAGTYTNDFVTIGHNLTLQAVGGIVTMNATVAPPNGKAIIDEGGSGVTVKIDGFELTGASVGDGNGAGVRYEGGALTLTNDYIHGNQDGILGAPDANGSITIDHSEFVNNGAGDGRTHNIYIGDIANFTLTNSLVTGAVVGHEVKSRAQNNDIENNRIVDGPGGTASYDIDLPNGGNATIANNVIEKASTAQNPYFITSGEEGVAYASNTLSVTGNTIVNDDASGSVALVRNLTGTTATVASNTVYGLTSGQLGTGIAASGTTYLTAEPALNMAVPFSVAAAASTSTTTTGTTTSGTTTTTGTTTTGTTTSGTTATGTTTSGTTTTGTTGTTTTGTTTTGTTTTTGSASAQVANVDTIKITVASLLRGTGATPSFVVSVDGTQVGGTQTVATGAAFKTISLTGDWASGTHNIAIDLVGATSTNKENIQVASMSYDGTRVSGATALSFGHADHAVSVSDTTALYHT